MKPTVRTDPMNRDAVSGIIFAGITPSLPPSPEELTFVNFG